MLCFFVAALAVEFRSIPGAPGKLRLRDFFHELFNAFLRLSLLLGDFSFVTSREDRRLVIIQAVRIPGEIKVSESSENNLWKHFEFNELQLDSFTRSRASARSRLDKIYSNNSLVDEVDREYSVYTLPWNTLSAHIAVACPEFSSQKGSRHP